MLISVISTLVCLTGIVIVTILHNQHWLDVTVRPAAAPADAPMISVIVPARDEERNIRRCVEALLAQTYPNFELIVAGRPLDRRHPQILADMARSDNLLHILKGEELPAGWAGKPHALYQAAQNAQGEWLCFVDADTFTSPQALASVYWVGPENNLRTCSAFLPARNSAPSGRR